MMAAVPKALSKHGVELRELSRLCSDPKALRSNIKRTKPPVIKLLKQLSKNILRGNIRLTPNNVKRLADHKDKLRELALSKTSVGRSRKLLTQHQKGGFLGALLAGLLPVILGSVLSKKKKKKRQ